MNTYLIVSETIYFINKTLDKIKNGIENVVTFNLDEDSIEEVLEEASYFSMFDEEKCIIVKNAHFFSSSKTGDSKKSKEMSTKLLNYLENENKNTKLIFITAKVDTKKKIYTILNNSGNVFASPNMTKTDMKNELLKYVNSKNYKIEDKSLWHIINNSLNNFDLCINEINKIMIYYSNPCNIKYEDVLNLVSKTIEDNIFKLVDSIIERDLSSSLKLLADSKILKTDPNIILSLLYREFKLMLSILIMEKNRVSKNNILGELKLAPWQYDKVINHLRMYNERELKEEIVKLSLLDYKNKSGLINKDVILTNYIMDLCS